MRDETNCMRDEINGIRDGKVGIQGKESINFNSPNNFMPSSQAFENNESKSNNTINFGSNENIVDDKQRFDETNPSCSGNTINLTSDIDSNLMQADETSAKRKILNPDISARKQTKRQSSKRSAKEMLLSDEKELPFNKLPKIESIEIAQIPVINNKRPKTILSGLWRKLSRC